MKKNKDLVNKEDLCYGCGCAGCSMCNVWNCKTKEEAIKKKKEFLEELHKDRKSLPGK